MPRIFLQVPEGLKTKVFEIADELGEDVIISGETCFGACDIKPDEAKRAGCEKIVHYGHTKFLESDMPVEYKEIREKIDVVPVLESNIEMIKDYERIGVVTTLQFLDVLADVKNYLESKGKKMILGKGQKTVYDGQVLGCDPYAGVSIKDDVDCFIYIGSGKFHPLGLLLKTEKPVFGLDIERNEMKSIDEFKDKFLRQKYAAIGMVKDAKRFGILVSSKPGQMNMDLAEKIKGKLRSEGKKAWILIFDEVKPEKLEFLDLDAYVNTACPRIAIEDRTAFKKPIVNPDELP
ncbi:MAG: diphthamide biosynthesis enzyme Dph2 [Candidatus Aenigmarchaeota archaeon]|nr:diphthamide biosynthesis enzyme Dph2 [Candidatus Aenigmarchaeota archaeon]